jgi:hypothetical protein
VGERLQELGYIVELTKFQGDHGVDLVARNSHETIVVQCKHHPGKSIGEPVLRDLFGALHHFKADRALLVTTGALTTQSRIWAEAKPIDAWDGQYLAARWPKETAFHSAPAEPNEDVRRARSRNATYLYRDDSGRRWSVELPRRQGDHPLLGFDITSGVTAPRLPANIHMRYVNWGGQPDMVAGKSMRTPVGSLPAVAELFRLRQIRLREADGSERQFYFASYRGEDS